MAETTIDISIHGDDIELELVEETIDELRLQFTGTALILSWDQLQQLFSIIKPYFIEDVLK